MSHSVENPITIRKASSKIKFVLNRVMQAVQEPVATLDKSGIERNEAYMK